MESTPKEMQLNLVLSSSWLLNIERLVILK